MFISMAKLPLECVPLEFVSGISISNNDITGGDKSLMKNL